MTEGTEVPNQEKTERSEKRKLKSTCEFFEANTIIQVELNKKKINE